MEQADSSGEASLLYYVGWRVRTSLGASDILSIFMDFQNHPPPHRL
jgi:hypothetical protein